MDNKKNTDKAAENNKKASQNSVYRYIGVLMALVVALLLISHFAQYRRNQQLKEELIGVQGGLRDVSDREQGVSARYAQLQDEFVLAQSRLDEAQRELATLKAQKGEEARAAAENIARLDGEKARLQHAYGLWFRLENAWRAGDTAAAAPLLRRIAQEYGDVPVVPEAQAMYDAIRAALPPEQTTAE